MIRVVCLKWGNKYPSEYVNRLHGAVSRNLNRPFTFHCVTDDEKGLNEEIEVLPLPDIGLEGWWYKLLFFKKGFLPFSENDIVLYLDLDVVILGELEGILSEFKGGLCISADDAPDRMNSSVMVFSPHTLGFIWESFDIQKDYVLSKYHGDQDWIEQVMPSAKIFSKKYVCSFKLDLDSKTPFSFGAIGRFFRKAFPGLLSPRGTVPKPNCSIVLFHGRPNPHEVMDGPWDKYRHAPWVKEYWR